MSWNDIDETCFACGAVTKRARGITKQSLKRLITPKWDLNELLITFILIMVIIMALLYKSETQQCRDFIKNMNTTQVDYPIGNSNYWNLTLNTNFTTNGTNINT